MREVVRLVARANGGKILQRHRAALGMAERLAPAVGRMAVIDREDKWPRLGSP